MERYAFLFSFPHTSSWLAGVKTGIPLFVRPQCVRQRNEVAIILGIISPLSSSSLWAFCSELTWSLIG